VQAFRGRLRINQPRRRIKFLLLRQRNNVKHSPSATPTRLEYSEFEELPAGRKVYYLRPKIPAFAIKHQNNSTILVFLSWIV
jgi:hypothetical protein